MGETAWKVAKMLISRSRLGLAWNLIGRVGGASFVHQSERLADPGT